MIMDVQKLNEKVLSNGMTRKEYYDSLNRDFTQDPRATKVELKPLASESPVALTKGVEVSQAAADAIEIGVKGDSLALIAISQALDCWASFDTSERMEHWNGVTVWKSGPNKGRVRSAAFKLFSKLHGVCCAEL